MSKQIEIALNKTKIGLLLVASILFVLAGCWFVFDPPHLSNRILSNPIILFVTGIAAILFFGISSVFLSWKLFDKRPGMIINEEGITDNSSAVSPEFIPWNDIQAITTTYVANQKFLMLIVKNPDDYINKQKSFLIKKAMKMNHKSYGSPITITANGLKYNFNELFEIIQIKFNEYKNYNSI